MGASENIGRSEFQTFIKPAGPLCNLNCSYCYYSEKSKLYQEGPIRIMDEDLLEICIKQIIDATTEPVITFSWHGGEPLLAGIDFYKKAVSIQKQWCPPGKTILNGIQTNGTLLTEEWCRFLSDNHFLAGISIDGPQSLHDNFRKGKDEKGTFRKVMKGFDLLVMHGLEPEILCVVNSVNAHFPLEVYDFFRPLGVTYLTFIPLVERLEGSSAVSDRSVEPEDFGNFLCSIFDQWLAFDIGQIKVQIFEEALRTAFDQDHTLCIFKPVCGGVPVVEHNGDFYSCDHFVNPEHLVGNIRDLNISKMLESKRQRSFGRRKSESLPLYCRSCEVIAMCNGECPKNRFTSTPGGEPGLNYLCRGYKKFFNHCRPFKEAVMRVNNNNQQ
jgi:uncharacterized protein